MIVPLNTEYEDASSIVDSASLPAFSLFSLAAGTYRIEADSPFYLTGITVTRLYNVTDEAVQQNLGALDMYDMYGTVVYSDQSNPYSPWVNSCLVGTFTITGTKQFRIEYKVAVTKATSGMGVASNYGPEVYAQVKIIKVN